MARNYYAEINLHIVGLTKFPPESPPSWIRMTQRTILLVFLPMLILGGCGGSRDTAPAKLDGPAFLALGDSYTIGQGVEPAERWPVQLAARLRQDGTSVGDPTILAKTGWTTDELSAAMDREKLQGPYALVTLLIGVNNQYRGRSLDEYRKEFAVLLQRAIKLAGGKPERVLVLSIPDWGVTPVGGGRNRAQTGRAIDAFNAVNREEALRASARYVDITPGSRLAADSPTLIASDGLHPSGKMYKAWVDAVLPSAQAVLGKQP